MEKTNLARSLEDLGRDVFGIALQQGRAEVVGEALIGLLAEIERLRSLDLSGIEPVVIFDPVKAAEPGPQP